MEDVSNLFADKYKDIVQQFTDITTFASTSFLSMALFFCGIGTLIYLVTVFVLPLMRGSEISIESITRPFMITMLLMLYPEVIGSINGVFNYASIEMDKSIVQMMKDNPYHSQIARIEKYKSQQDSLSYISFVKSDIDKQKLKEVSNPDKNNGNAVDEKQAEESTLVVGQMQKQQETKWYHHIAGTFFTWLIGLLTSFARNIVLLVSRFLLAILIMVGPLAIAFSVFPNWKEGLNSFFSRLIGFHMWYPIALCLDLVFHFGLGALINIFEGDVYMQYTISVYVSIIAIFTYFSVPAFAGWIIPNGGGDGGVVAGIKSASSMALGYLSGHMGKMLGSYAAASKKARSIGKVGSGGEKS